MLPNVLVYESEVVFDLTDMSQFVVLQINRYLGIYINIVLKKYGILKKQINYAC